MKTKTENRKFTLEKFEVARLKNMRLIQGGGEVGPNGGNDDTGTGQQQNASSKNCQVTARTILKV